MSIASARIILLVFLYQTEGLQTGSQAKAFNPDTVFAALRAEINSDRPIRENGELAQQIFGAALTWRDIEPELGAWRPAFTSKTNGSNSGSVVAISPNYILKSESSTFYNNFVKIKNAYYARARNDESCLQKIRFVFKTGNFLKSTYWFVIENSNRHAADRMEFSFDMKASRQIGKDSKYSGEKGKMGFTDDFFFMKELQQWNYGDDENTQPLRTALRNDLKVFSDNWDTVNLVDFSLLIFINRIAPVRAGRAYQPPANCVTFTRNNPETGDEEILEMCVSIIDFFAHLDFKKSYAQRKGQIKVYDTGAKFDSTYAGKLRRLADDMLVANTYEQNLVRHYIPQARIRHQKKAVEIALDYFKDRSRNGKDATYAQFRTSYYLRCAHGLSEAVIRSMYDICSEGLADQNDRYFGSYSSTFVSDVDKALKELGFTSTSAQWKVIEAAISKIATAPVDADGREVTAGRAETEEMFANKLEELQDFKMTKDLQGNLRRHRR